MRRVAFAWSLVILFGLATGCSPPDPAEQTPAQFTVRGRWPTATAITYRIETARSPIDASSFVRAIERAAKVWSDTGVISFRAATATDSAADVTIGWRRGHHGACQPFGPGVDVAHSGPVAPGTFIHFDLGRTWTEASVFGTALHELGHVLGLGHSEAPEAVMSTNPTRPVELSLHDLAGVHSLYGDMDSLETGRGDLNIGGGTTMLRRASPHATCRRARFDTDGDGDSELLIWRIDPAGHGTLMIYHFTLGPKLARTIGPLHGAVAPGATVQFVKSEAGDRYLVSKFENGNSIVRQFDRHGIPVQPSAPLPNSLLERAEARPTGDLDGVGGPEVIHIQFGSR